MNELTKKVSLLGTGLVVGATAFTVIGASAHPGDGDGTHRGRGEAISEVLGVSVDELKTAKQDGQTLEEIVANNGFESLEAFEAEMEAAIREKLAERGFSAEEIDEKISQMQQRREVKEDVREARQSVLGLTREEFKAKIDAGMSREEILAEAGFDSKDAVKDAVGEALSEAWSSEGLSEEEIQQRLEKFEDRRGHRGFGRHHQSNDS